MKHYTPNFNDPRTQRAARQALRWATTCLSEHKPKGWARTHLDKKIGYAHTNLGRYLRHALLITHNTHWNMHQRRSKEYLLNTHGAVELAQQLGINYKRSQPRRSIGTQLAIEAYKPIFDQGVFEYTHKSNRQWHELQNLQSDCRRDLFAHYGYAFNYDIQNCYPTLVYEYCRLYTRPRTPLTLLREYINNPTHYKTQLAHDVGCDPKTAKKILLAIFNGATLSPWGDIARSLTRLQMYKLKNNTWLKEFRKELHRAWANITRAQGKRYMNRRAKMKFYLEQESKTVRRILREFSGHRTFLEHDGWRSTHHIDTRHLELCVEKTIGYHIKITCEVIQ